MISALLQAISPATAPGSEQLDWTEVISSYLKFAGYFLSIGAVGYRFLLLPRFERDKTGEAVIGRAAAALLGLAGVLLLIFIAVGNVQLNALVHHRSFAASMPKAVGRLRFQLVALAVSLVGFTLARRVSVRAGWSLAAAGVLAVVLQPIVTARGFVGRVNAVHILAASTWLGTLAVMLWAGIRALMRAPSGGMSREVIAASLVNAFTPVALTAATVVGLTGATTAWLHVKHLSNLWKTDYGIALLIKLVFVLGVVLVGWWNWKRVKPSLEGAGGSVARLQRSAMMELALGAIVLAVTAVLVSLPSPR